MAAPAILGPTPFTNQRHERDGAQIFLLEFSLALAGKLEQRLMTFFLADRNDETAADRELRFQRRPRQSGSATTMPTASAARWAAAPPAVVWQCRSSSR